MIRKILVFLMSLGRAEFVDEPDLHKLCGEVGLDVRGFVRLNKKRYICGVWAGYLVFSPTFLSFSKEEKKAVLLHEKGHFVYRRGEGRFLNPFYLSAVFLFFFIPMFLYLPVACASVLLYFIFMLIPSLFIPFYYFRLFNRSFSEEEFKADEYAVKQGYGKALISVFKKMRGLSQFARDVSYIDERIGRIRRNTNR